MIESELENIGHSCDWKSGNFDRLVKAGHDDGGEHRSENLPICRQQANCKSGKKYFTQKEANILMEDIPYDIGKRYAEVI